MANIGIPGLILIVVIALMIFGPSQLPEIGRAFGNTLKEFKKSTSDLVSNDEEENRHISETNTFQTVETRKGKTGS